MSRAPVLDWYQFRFHRAAVHPDLNASNAWAEAVEVTTVAETEADARAKALAMSGEPPEGRRWELRLDDVAFHHPADPLPLVWESWESPDDKLYEVQVTSAEGEIVATFTTDRGVEIRADLSKADRLEIAGLAP